MNKNIPHDKKKNAAKRLDNRACRLAPKIVFEDKSNGKLDAKEMIEILYLGAKSEN
ncbi:hypothetical protein [Leptospira kanakyensis]|uniref:hypothetical protein n=1 Tax=Leptospira kanakyensis TaxID=2484968 RepID=UPI00223D0186|nr:hypothetical protein [Leptospira kanakyensis]MCW7470769.1 hypothetical protein [Leptospira kanakyensis]